MTATETANEHQVGGTHYRSQPFQHWDFVVENRVPYLEAQVVKYLSRWRAKGGLKDLLKADHFLEKTQETEAATHLRPWVIAHYPAAVNWVKYADLNNLPATEWRVGELTCTWWCGELPTHRALEEARAELDTLIQAEQDSQLYRELAKRAVERDPPEWNTEEVCCCSQRTVTAAQHFRHGNRTQARWTCPVHGAITLDPPLKTNP